MESKSKGVIAIAFLLCLVLFIGMCLFIASFSVVEPTYMAISRNKMSSQIDKEKVYFEGRHFLGVASEFIVYPMAWQLVEYTDDNINLGGNGSGIVDYICKAEDTALDAATSEGLSVSVELSLYFTISPKQLINFYTNYGVNYQDSLANECKKVLKDTVTKFQYTELFKGRLMISNAMKQALNKALARRRCVLQKLLLRGISFSDSVESKIEESVIADQAKAQNEYKSQIEFINAEIETLGKDYSLRINEVMARAQKNATITVEEARAYAASKNAESTALAWKSYQQSTGLNSEELLRVQWARTIGATTKTDNIVLGYDKVGTKYVQQVKV